MEGGRHYCILLLSCSKISMGKSLDILPFLIKLLISYRLQGIYLSPPHFVELNTSGILKLAFNFNKFTQ
jgi:hypothetical protein